MQLREHDTHENKKVWLSHEESDRLLDAADGTEEWVAIALGLRCGLRSHEILEVAPKHIVRDDRLGYVLRVPEGKGDSYRETPCPESVERSISAMQDARDASASAPVVSVTSTRTLQRWVGQAARRVDSEDRGWGELTPHDLRRTWATNLAASDVDPLVVCDWGGWNDLETFLDHYRGTYSPEKQREERAKVDWL